MTILTAVIGGTFLGLMAGVVVGAVRKMRELRDGISDPAQEPRDDGR